MVRCPEIARLNPPGGASREEWVKVESKRSQSGERFNVFERRARRYPMPYLMTPEEQVKAGLKSLRNRERFSLSVVGDDAISGRRLPDRTAFVYDLARMVDRLPQPQKAIILLYFCARRPDASQCQGDDCQSCQQHYGNEQVARDLERYGYTLSDRDVGRVKQQVISRIALRFWPSYYRNIKRRAMGV